MFDCLVIPFEATVILMHRYAIELGLTLYNKSPNGYEIELIFG